MKYFLLLLFVTATAVSQILQLPARGPFTMTGSRLYPSLVQLSRSEREDTILKNILNGNVPDFLRHLVPVSSSTTINGTVYTLQYFVTPDYLSIGNDSDYFLMPMTPVLAQKIANHTHCMLPTAQMVDQIYAASTVKLRPQPIPPDAEMDKMRRFFQHNDSVRTLRNPLLWEFPLGSLVGGTKKDVVIDNKISSWKRKNVPKPVVIYGWHQLNGSPIQPVYNGHGETYADYSHGIRLVQTTALINGAEISLIDIIQDSLYSTLICDSVVAKPYYELPLSEQKSMQQK